MPENKFTEEQVEGLAPDTASVKAAQKVYAKANWEVFKSERAVWSAIKGSGKKPYLTRMDLEDTAFKCSCPSRKFPCKHGLSLALYLARNPMESIDVATEPLWVAEWIDKRRNKVAKAAAKPKKAVSPEQTKKKSLDKWKAAIVNIEHLELWLQDFVNSGLIDLASKSDVYFEHLKRRMVDFKLPGVNIFLNAIQAVDFSRKGWEQKVLKQVYLLHVLVTSVKRHEQLDAAYKKELELLLGWNIKKDELLLNKETEIVDDVWLIVNVVKKEEEGLTSRKTYLYGSTTNRWAYILDFSFRGAGFSDSYVQGQKLQAKMAMYPGLHKTRAILKIKGNQTDVPLDLKPIPSFKEANAAFRERKIQFPFTFDMPLFLASAKLVRHDEAVYLVSHQDEVILCKYLSDDNFFNVLAITKGEWFDVFLVMDEKGAELLAIYFDNKMYSL